LLWLPRLPPFLLPILGAAVTAVMVTGDMITVTTVDITATNLDVTTAMIAAKNDLIHPCI
jgi:hypothetical protein